MSRCFPYPPPGYVLPEKKQPLIESIKLQKDKEKSKEERRKERKREKKDKKRKREVQSTPTLDKYGQEKLVNEKSQKLEKQSSTLKGKYVKNQVDDVCSDLTNEHEQPIYVAKPSYSSEDSQNSDKRRRLELRTNSIERSGSVLKIRLTPLNKREDKSSSNKEIPDFVKDLPSTSGRTYPIIQNNIGFGQRLVKGHVPSAKTKVENHVEKQPILLETQKPNKDVTVAKTSTSKRSKVELLYKSLLDSFPSALGGDRGRDDDDDDWLFQKKFQNTEISETTSKAVCCLDSNLWPRAQFLPSVDVYALPYTVPF